MTCQFEPVDPRDSYPFAEHEALAIARENAGIPPYDDSGVFRLEPAEEDDPICVDSDWINTLRSVLAVGVIAAAAIAAFVFIHAHTLHH